MKAKPLADTPKCPACQGQMERYTGAFPWPYHYRCPEDGLTFFSADIQAFACLGLNGYSREDIAAIARREKTLADTPVPHAR